MELIEYITKSFSECRVIGERAPSIIVRHEERSFVIYTAKHTDGRYAVCFGDDRYYSDDPEEIRCYIIQQCDKINRKENINNKKHEKL